MYLNKLYCDKSSFKEIDFKNDGFNIILGKSTSHENKNTFNGIGKTLSLQLINFCLGSSKLESVKSLKDWNFYLDFTMNGRNFTAARNSSEQGNIILNNKENKLEDFKYFMESELFNFEKEYNYLTYRNLIARFMRIPPHAYNQWNGYSKNENSESKHICTSFLLGLDLNLTQEKYKLNDKIDKVKKSKKVLSENNEYIKDILESGLDISISISNLKTEIDELEKSISEFNISEEYNSIKTKLDDLKFEKNDILNEINLLENRLKNINKSLKIKIDVSSTEVIELYKESNLILPDSINKSLNEVYDFHSKLLESRQTRLRKDREKMSNDLVYLNNKLEKLNYGINENSKYLSKVGSLSEYQSLQEKYTDLKLKLQKAESYKNLLSEMDKELRRLEKELLICIDSAQTWIDDNSSKIEYISNKFKEFVDYIYDDKKAAGISIKVNEKKNNKICFDITPEIAHEESLGINKVKIFCIDFIYLLLQNNHTVKFLYHDNAMFSETDPRQSYKMLKLAKEICEQNNFQYIFNINDDLLNNIIKIAESYYDYEFIKYLNERVVLTLLDTCDEDKLLGVNLEKINKK